RKRNLPLAHQDDKDAGDISRPMMIRVASKKLPRGLISQRREVSDGHAIWLPADADNLDGGPIDNVKCRESRFGNGALQDERTGVISNTTHDVEPSGRARHNQRRARLEVFALAKRSEK